MSFKKETIGDVVESITNGVNCKQNKEGNGVKITRIETIANRKINYQKTGFSKLTEADKNKYKLIKGDILFSHINSPIHVGKVAIYNGSEDLYHGVNLLKLRVKNYINPYYFKYFLDEVFQSGYWKRTSKQSVNQASVNQTDIKKIDFSYPILSDQQRIVAKLDSIFAEIDNKEQINLKKLDYINRLKKSTLDSKLGNNLIKLSEACDLIKRGISPKYLETGGVAVINQKCIRNHIIDYSKARRHNINLKKVPEERFIKKGDVLINSTGHGTLGRVAQVNPDPAEKTTVDSHVTIIRPKQKLFDLGYFANALIKIEKQLEAAGEGASGQTELSRSKLESEFDIPYIDSIDKQRKVSLIINSIFENIYILKNSTVKIIENLKSLKLSFLNKEFHNK